MSGKGKGKTGTKTYKTKSEKGEYSQLRRDKLYSHHPPCDAAGLTFPAARMHRYLRKVRSLQQLPCLPDTSSSQFTNKKYRVAEGAGSAYSRLIPFGNEADASSLTVYLAAVLE